MQWKKVLYSFVGLLVASTLLGGIVSARYNYSGPGPGVFFTTTTDHTLIDGYGGAFRTDQYGRTLISPDSSISSLTIGNLTATTGTIQTLYVSSVASSTLLKAGSIEANTINSLNTTVPMSFTSYDNDDVNAVSFSYNAGTALTTIGSKLASFKNAGVEKLYIAYDGAIYLGSSIMRTTLIYAPTVYHGSGGLQNTTMTEGVLIKGRIADGGANPAVIIDNSTLLATAGNKLLSIRNAGAEKAYVDYLGSYSQSGLTTKKSSETVADDGTITLPTGVVGWGEVQIGDDQEYAYFSVKADGTVLLRINSTNVVNTDTDANLCIYDDGAGAVIKNRLGSSLTVRYTFNY